MAESKADDPADVPPPVEDKPLTPEEVSAVTEKMENGKVVTREAFTLGLRRLLNLSIEGYPRAIRSTLAIRNEYLRKHNGVQAAAIEQATADFEKSFKKQQTDEDRKESIHQDNAAEDALNEYGKYEMRAALIALVPYVGLSSSLVFLAWTSLRKTCLIAAIDGHDLSSEETRAKILYVYAGIRVSAAGALGIERATGVIWTAIAGPVAQVIPAQLVAAVLSSVAISEFTTSALYGVFHEGKREVPIEEYEQILDPEPTNDDYAALLKDSTLYALLLARSQASRAWDIVTDKQRMEANSWLAKATGLGKTQEIKRFFDSIDTNGDGVIQEDEFVAHVSKKGFSRDECLKLLGTVDKDSDGNINFDEFTAWVNKGADNNIAAKNGIYYKESAIALGAKAASKLQSGYAIAKDGAAKAAAAVSGYAAAAAAAAESYKGEKKTEEEKTET